MDLSNFCFICQKSLIFMAGVIKCWKKIQNKIELIGFSIRGSG